jgi:hypothetical protein
MNQTLPMPFFNVVRDALDTMYVAMPGTAAELDPLVVQAIVGLGHAYLNLANPGTQNPSYAPDISRLGYVFTYAAAHAHYMRSELNRLSQTIHARLDPRRDLYVTSLGGGPGSDLLGLFAHLSDMNAGFLNVYCRRCDREAGWDAVSSLLLRHHAPPVRAKVINIAFDVTVPQSYVHQNDALRSTVFLASYFLSELVKAGAASDGFWDNLRSQAPRGALFIVLDNASDHFIPAIEAMMARAGFSTLDSEQGSMRIDESWEPLEGYIERYDRRPRRKGEVYFAVFEKR